MRSEPRLLADQDDVGVHELEPRRAHVAVGPRQEIERPDTPPALVVRGKERTDVVESRGPEQRIEKGVRDDVAVRVACEPEPERDLDTAEDERASLLEAVRVDTEADAKLSNRG